MINEDVKQLEGTVERIVFFNEENGYFVGEFRVNEGKIITIVGILPAVHCGETLRIKGKWTRHPEYGDQFKVEGVESQLPATVYGIKKYLSSGLIDGVGKGYADRIVDHFGEDTFRVISEQSARLKEVPGIGKQRAQAIKKSWDQQRVVRDIMIFFQTYGITIGQCLRLHKTYGDRACEVVKANPYRMAREIDGIGFKTADKIALNLGFASDSPFRIEGGILFGMSELETNGHTCLELQVFIDYVLGILGVEEEKIKERLKVLIDERRIIDLGDGRVQSVNAYLAESRIGEDVCRILKAKSLLPQFDVELALQWVEKRLGFDLAIEQRDWVLKALHSKISILTGGPGTGKTTVLRVLASILRAKKVNVVLTAPTGRAAQRMKEAIGFEARTVHRLLKLEPGTRRFFHNEERPLTGDFFIVDEASMLDIYLMSALIKAIPSEAHVLFVGDVFQLPSVGPGNVLKDLIDSKLMNVKYLKRIYRQSERSGIIEVAHGILEGAHLVPNMRERIEDIDPAGDVHFIKEIDPAKCVEIVKKLCNDQLTRWYLSDPMADVQVLVPMHKGTAGISTFNVELQSVLNNLSAAQGPVDTWRQFRVGDRILQLKNNYDKNIFNGDLGRILFIDKEKSRMVMDFNGEEVALEGVELEDVGLAYAMSIHKSQGSEFPIVIIPLLKQHFLLLQRNLLYTALTRGRHKVFFVGDPVAYQMAVRNAESVSRVTGLKEQLLKFAKMFGLI